MEVTVHEVLLTQRHVWRSAREEIAAQPGLVVEVEHDGISGYGEAAAFMTATYRSGLPQLHADLRRIAPVLAGLDPYDPPAATWKVLLGALPEAPFVLAALDSALHDLHARLHGVPLWQSLGLERPTGLRSSFSVGIDTASTMVHKLRERPGWHAYKVKLADPGDLSTLRALHDHTDAPFYVDGNCGWQASRTLPALEALRELGVRLLEQPYPRDHWEQAAELKAVSPFPVIADESMTGPEDLQACARSFHGINVKPMKAGGITPTLEILRQAGDLDLEVVEYLKHPPGREKLAQLYRDAGMAPRDGVRTSGTDAKERGLTGADDDTVLDAMMADPRLIERPLVETEKGVRLCRPPERVREIL